MNTTSHIMGGQWRHPAAQQHRFNELELWTSLARQLEDAKFDVMFFADVVGLYGTTTAAGPRTVRRGMQVPANDPLILLGLPSPPRRRTSAWRRRHRWSKATPSSSPARSPPWTTSPRGRAAWNIVTSAAENAHRNFGDASLAAHDDRYAWADEYVAAAYKLWEGSWDDGALVQGKEDGVRADPDKVHKIYHRGAPVLHRRAAPVRSPRRSARPCCSRRGARPRAAACAPRRGHLPLPPSPPSRAEYTRPCASRRRRWRGTPEHVKFFRGSTSSRRPARGRPPQGGGTGR